MHEPTGRDPAPPVRQLARLHVAGWSDARIAAALAGCDRSTVTRTRKRPLLVEMIAAERKREQARLRQAAKRDRDRAAQQPEPVVATEPVAASFEDDPGRGQPGYPHQALGYVPVEQRPIRLPAPAGTHAADLELVKPVPARDLAALEADAWTRVEQRATPARGQAGQNTTPEARPPASQQIAGEQTTPDRAHPDDEASQPEIADRQAAAAAAARYVERLEAAYQHAFTAIETLVTAIEHVQQLRGQEHVWEHANTLGVAPKRPEPWHVRAAFDDQLRQLQKRLNQPLNSNW